MPSPNRRTVPVPRIMSRPWLAVAIAALLAAGPVASFAAAASDAARPAPQEAQVSVFLLGVRDFDQRRGTYVMDLYLDFFCPKGCSPDKFEFTNGTILAKEDASTGEENRTTYRVTAQLYGAMDMRKYPFDTQVLPLLLEDKVQSNLALRYLADEKHTARDPETQVAGWEIVGATATVDDHYYLTWDESYSRFAYRLRLARPVLASLLKVLLPSLMVVLCAFFALMLAIDRLNRLAVLTSTFITAVLLHLNSSANLPPVSYLTYMDLFMLLNYAAIVASIGLTVLVGRMHDSDRKEAAHVLNRRVQAIVPAAWLAAQGIAAFTLLG